MKALPGKKRRGQGRTAAGVMEVAVRKTSRKTDWGLGQVLPACFGKDLRGFDLGGARCVGRALEQRRMKQVVRSLPLWLNSQETSTSSHREAQSSLRGLCETDKGPCEYPSTPLKLAERQLSLPPGLRLLSDPSASFSSSSHCFLCFSSLSSLHLCLSLPLFFSLCPSVHLLAP